MTANRVLSARLVMLRTGMVPGVDTHVWLRPVTGPVSSAEAQGRCLVAVDVQKGMLSPLTSHLPARIRDFCDAFPAEHKVFTRFLNPGPSGPFLELFGWDGMSSPEEVSLAEEVADLATLVVDKHTYSPFVPSALLREAQAQGTCEDAFYEWLRSRHVTQAFVFGMDTEVCVLTTAVGLLDRGIQPVVVSDLCGSQRALSLHHVALQLLPRYIGPGRVLTTQQLLQ